MNRYVGNLPPMPGVFPDYPAPVVRNVGTEVDFPIRPHLNGCLVSDSAALHCTATKLSGVAL
jgi:hypothetical protein